MQAKCQVTRYPAALSERAVQHFASRLAFETDCWDVHHALHHGVAGFVLLDVRSTQLFRQSHVPGAVHLPHATIAVDTLPPLGHQDVYVVYCAGPHCNGAQKAALRIARLGFPVKEMIGGVEGWKDEGFSLVSS